MRLVVISDSHRKASAVDDILSVEKDSCDIFFLGDVVSDIEDFTFMYPQKSFHIVSGNCDYISNFPSVDLVKLGGKTILFTHGHNYGVKEGIASLLKAAKKCGADIVLYGHTHSADISYLNGIFLVNPGSCSKSRNGRNSYAVIDITEKGIMPIIKNI